MFYDFLGSQIKYCASAGKVLMQEFLYFCIFQCISIFHVLRQLMHDLFIIPEVISASAANIAAQALAITLLRLGGVGFFYNPSSYPKSV